MREADLGAIDRELNEKYECRVIGCDRRVGDPNAICIGCAAGIVTGDVVRNPEGRRIKRGLA